MSCKTDFSLIKDLNQSTESMCQPGSATEEPDLRAGS